MSIKISSRNTILLSLLLCRAKSSATIRVERRIKGRQRQWSPGVQGSTTPSPSPMIMSIRLSAVKSWVNSTLVAVSASVFAPLSEDYPKIPFELENSMILER